MSGFRVLLGKEMLELRRTMHFAAVLILFAVAGLLSPVLAKYTQQLVTALAGNIVTLQLPTPTTGDAIDQLLKNVGQFGALAAILLTMGTVAGEKERGTARLVLTMPASRSAFLLAKFAAIALTLLVSTAAAGILGYAYTALLFQPPDLAGFALLCALLWLSLLVYAAFTFVGSAFAGSALAAGGFGFTAVIVAGILSVLPAVGPYMPASLASAARPMALGQPGSDVLGPLIFNALLVAALVVVAAIAFRRQEL